MMNNDKPQGLQDLLNNVRTQQMVKDQIESSLPGVVKKELESQKKSIIEGITSNIIKDTKEIADKSFDDLRRKLEQDRLNVIQATSIVTLFIGFLVIQFNILGKFNSTAEIAGYSLLLLSCISLFIILLDLIIKIDLPFKKYSTKKSPFDTSSMFEAFITRREEVPLTLNPHSWGEGLIIRVVAILISLIIGACGVSLVIYF